MECHSGVVWLAVLCVGGWADRNAELFGCSIPPRGGEGIVGCVQGASCCPPYWSEFSWSLLLHLGKYTRSLTKIEKDAGAWSHAAGKSGMKGKNGYWSGPEGTQGTPPKRKNRFFFVCVLALEFTWCRGATNYEQYSAFILSCLFFSPPPLWHSCMSCQQPRV